MDGESLNLARMLLARLERISADSYLAHRASGIRGSLLRLVDQLEKGQPLEGPGMKRLIAVGFQILEDAAIEKASSSFISKTEPSGVLKAGFLSGTSDLEIFNGKLNGRKTKSENAQDSAGK